MFKFFTFLCLITLTNGLEKSSDLRNSDKDNFTECCVDHAQKKIRTIEMGNYNCSQLTSFGKDRCNGIFRGQVCNWDICPIQIPINKCQVIRKYEMHYGKKINVGDCGGLCKGLKQICSPSTFEYIELRGGTLKIIKECECSDCGVVNTNNIIEVPGGKCIGKCDVKDIVCLGGINDEYGELGQEPTNPSTQLLTSASQICSLGVQNSFDTFIDNRCFVHTFDKCDFSNKECLIKTIFLDICMKAANVQLTNTDSIRLGTNGNGLWGESLPSLNSGSWNPGDNICLTFDLDNLNGGVSIINNIITSNNLDVLVQDDTAVDYINIRVLKANCEKCLPIHNVVNSLFTLDGLTEIRHIKDCSCINVRKCHREILEETYYPGTNFERTIDIGQCLGSCDHKICRRTFKSPYRIKTPIGNSFINVIDKCYC